jgi:hypothetical protein
MPTKRLAPQILRTRLDTFSRHLQEFRAREDEHARAAQEE